MEHCNEVEDSGDSGAGSHFAFDTWLNCTDFCTFMTGDGFEDVNVSGHMMSSLLHAA